MGYNYFGELTIVTCASCGIVFGVPPGKIEDLRKTHKDFYCPNGHMNYYQKKSREEKLEDQLNRTVRELQSEKQCCEDKRRSLSATRGAVTKLKQRLEEVNT